MKIAVLTSGGDAPGMNAALRAVVRSGIKHGHEVYGVRYGYKGLLAGDWFKFKKEDVANLLQQGGTYLGSARSKDFMHPEYKEKAAKLLLKDGIEYLVVIGGEGSAKGARDIEPFGIKTVVIPGTIDNDYAGSDYSIGFHTALNTIVESVDKVRDTSTSHNRCMVIEVMGRDKADLAINAAIACGAEFVITKENEYDIPQMISSIKKMNENKRKHVLVILSELITNANELAKEIEEKTGMVTRSCVLSQIQRGGSPVPYDRLLATALGDYAIQVLEEGKHSQSVGMINNKLVAMDINKALKKKKDIKPLFKLFEVTNK